MKATYTCLDGLMCVAFFKFQVEMTDKEFKQVIKDACPECDEKGRDSIFNYIKSLHNKYDRDHIIEDDEIYNVAAEILLKTTVKPPKTNKAANGISWLQQWIDSGADEFDVELLIKENKLYGATAEKLRTICTKPVKTKVELSKRDESLVRAENCIKEIEKILNKKAKPENVYYMKLWGDISKFLNQVFNTKIEGGLEYNDNMLQYEAIAVDTFDRNEFVTRILEYDYPIKTDKINTEIFFADNYTAHINKSKAKRIKEYELILSPNYDEKLTRKYIRDVISKEQMLDFDL